ncbi:GAF domain-containing protein [Dietzia maris]|nr:GAF domain-containing protein [Dietzia maris]MBB0997693.1 GAF domain-containing protein [Dietzia maris]
MTRPILPWAIAGVAVVVAPVSAYAATEAEGWHTWVWLVIGSIAALVAWGVPLMRQNVLNDQHKQALAAANNRARLAEEQALKAEEREVEALTEARIVVSYAIWPVVTALAEHVACNAKPDRDKALPKVVKAVCASAAHRLGETDRTRACFFELVQSPVRALKPGDGYGRTGSSRSTFTEGTEAGDAALAMVDELGTYFCHDVDSDPPKGWNGSGKDYRTFISVTVAANDVPYGMLTLDSPDPGDLTEQDRRMLTVLAALLGVALSR